MTRSRLSGPNSATAAAPPSLLATPLLPALRWGAFFCQLLLTTPLLLLSPAVPPATVTALLLFGMLCNFYFSHRTHSQATVSPVLFGAVMFIDILLITALLPATGGPLSPLAFLYLVHIAMGSALMRPLHRGTFAVLAGLCYGSFFLPFRSASTTVALYNTAPNGWLWIAFATTAGFMVFLTTRFLRESEHRQKTLGVHDEHENNNERLGIMATLAADTAHEIATPLSLIAVASGEMLHHIHSTGNNRELLDDATLINEQIRRCRNILDRMATETGEPFCEAAMEITVAELVADALADLPHPQQQRIHVHNPVGSEKIYVPGQTLSRIIRGMLKNSLDATGENGLITLRCWRDDAFYSFEFQDNGQGMNSEALRKATTPFYTTKADGKGLGLGLFLAKAVTERFGGTLRIHSEPNRGTRVTMTLAHKKTKVPLTTPPR